MPRNPEKDRERKRRFHDAHPGIGTEYSRRWREKNPERYRANVKRWQQDNRDRLRAATARCRANGGKEREREANMRRLYGIGFAEYHALLVAQGGTCAICQGVEPTGARFNVDHDHSTGAVRGLLCRKCNAAIGLLGDDPDMVLRPWPTC